ncbi:MAG: alpha/beta fold hydrolase [Thermoanaerobaculia bacterium]
MELTPVVSIPELIARFELHDWGINRQAADALAAIGEEAVPALIKALSSPDPYVRSGAAQALRSFPAPRAYDALVEALHNSFPGPSDDGEVNEARHHAALALGTLGDQRACAELLKALPDCLADYLSVSWYIMDALAMLRCPDAIPALEACRDHGDIDVRKSSRSALAVLKLPMFAGSRQMQVQDEAQGISFPVLVLYPTAVPSAPTAFGPYTIDASADAPIAEGPFPLVVVSHGNSGSHLAYRSFASHLARNGYVVAMLEHPGNNRNDNRLEGTYENLVNRPRHVRLTLDAVSLDAQFWGSVQPLNVAIIGHSIGGYTALAVAGGTPWTETRQRVEVVPDPRVRALVLLAPATAWYLPEDSLRNVTVPILMLTAEHDPFTPRWHADLVLDRVPDRSRVTWRIVENAGHFSFLSPFPPPMRSAGFLPSTDPEGFDREAFHERLSAELLEFLDKKLKRL